MQIVRCVQCDTVLCRIDQQGNVYDIKAGRDDKPFSRVDDKGNPVPRKDVKKAAPRFHLDDRKQAKREVEMEKGLFEEETVEEPHSITCRCGYKNLIY
jgi:hypothetical protein